MKPFNLEEAKAGKPVCMRNGRAVRIIYWDKVGDSYPIVALAQSQRSNAVHEGLYCYTTDGEYFAEDGEHEYDLFMAPVQRTVWVNLYKASEAKVGMVSGGLYASEQEAVLIAGESPSYVGTFPITYEE